MLNHTVVSSLPFIPFCDPTSTSIHGAGHQMLFHKKQRSSAFILSKPNITASVNNEGCHMKTTLWIISSWHHSACLQKKSNAHRHAGTHRKWCLDIHYARCMTNTVHESQTAISGKSGTLYALLYDPYLLTLIYLFIQRDSVPWQVRTKKHWTVVWGVPNTDIGLRGWVDPLLVHSWFAQLGKYSYVGWLQICNADISQNFN